MSAADSAFFLGQVFTAWALGFCGGYLFTIFKRAMEQI